jgi:hypothetical protein
VVELFYFQPCRRPERNFALGFASETKREAWQTTGTLAGRLVMPTNTEYEAAIRRLKWPGLQQLWADITSGTVNSWWPKGKAFEYLVVRMFELDRAKVTWPYPVYLFGGKAKEQIDGAVRFGGLHWLIESKDEDDTIAMDPIAKLRNQMLRRPWGTIGLVFTSTKFTPSAVQMTHFALPQPILLWTGAEVEHALRRKRICVFAQEKYRMCVEHGMVDFDITVL